MYRYLLLTILLLSAGEATAGLQRYVASEHESRWEATSTKLLCALSHEIPSYGKATFEHHAASELRFSLAVKRQPLQVGVARLTSLAPLWNHERLDRDLGQVDYTVARTPFRLRQVESRRLLSELEQGMFPTFSYPDWADGRDEVQVSLSAVNIRPALGKFLDCLVGQPAYDFAELQQSNLFFDSGSTALNARARERLDLLAGLLRADEGASRIQIYGYTDNRGSRAYNRRLSEGRVRAVHDYLVKQGVGAERFDMERRAFGEKQPLSSNYTADGRAQNRRVTVTLLREGLSRR